MTRHFSNEESHRSFAEKSGTIAIAALGCASLILLGDDLIGSVATTSDDSLMERLTGDPDVGAQIGTGLFLATGALSWALLSLREGRQQG